MQPVAELLEVGLGQLLHLVGRVATLQAVQRPALDGVRQDDGRLTNVRASRGERRVDLAVVVATPRQPAQIGVRHALDHLAQPRVVAEEVVADVLRGFDGVGLQLAVGGGVELVHECAVDVLGEQVVPVAAPDHLDDVPAGAAEVRLEFLDDLAVAAHRAVEALQVAVDDERQVVELFARRDSDRAERLGLVHLAVAEERPDMRIGRVSDAARLQVAVEPRLVDRVERTEAHGDGGELPEVRHEPRMRVAGQAVGRRLPAGSRRAVLRSTGLRGTRGRRCRGRRGPGRTPGRPCRRRGPCPEEMVEADLVEARGRA